MPRISLLAIGLMCAWWGCGCSQEPGPIEKMAKSTTPVPAKEEEPVELPPQTEPPMDDESEGEDIAKTNDSSKPDAADTPTDAPDENPAPEKTETPAPQELNLDEAGIKFVVPGDWKRVKPETKIIDAEFELARTEGDDYDGRLTLMASGGDPQDVIAIRTGEFKSDPDERPTTEKLDIDGYEATLVDLRGEWKGTSFRPMPPRADYRMLLLVVPYTERSAFYAKLTGPRATIAVHEKAFRDFLRTAKVTREVPK